MIFVSYFYTDGVVQNQILNNGEEVMNSIEAAITARLNEAETTVVATKHSIENMIDSGADEEKIQNYLRDWTSWLKGRDPGISDLYGVVRGEFLSGNGWEPDDDYNPRTRNWYLGVLFNDGLYFTDPYIDRQLGGLVISVADKIESDTGKFYGVVSMDVVTDSITNYAKKSNILDDGYGVLLNNYNEFLTHGDEDLIGTSLYDVNEGYDEIGRRLRQQGSLSAVRFKDYDGSESVGFFRRLYNDWIFGLVIPLSTYMRVSRNLLIALSLIGVALMSALNFILVRLYMAKEDSDEARKSATGFLANVSHEIRTPMNEINGMAELALREDLPQSAREQVLNIKEAGACLLAVINDLLDYSRIDAGKVEIIEEAYGLEPLVNEVIALTVDRAREKAVEYTVFVDPEAPAELLGDSVRIRQAVVSLLKNAISCTREGDIFLEVLFSPAENGGVVEFRVGDGGGAMEEEQVESAFEGFASGGVAGRRSDAGGGLGLAIARKLCRAMGGDILLQGATERGCVFSLKIPQKVVGNKVFAKLRNTSRKVIVSLNSQAVARPLERTLKALGVEAFMAKPGEEFTAALASGKYSLAFVDAERKEAEKAAAENKGVCLVALDMPAHAAVLACIIDDNEGDSTTEKLLPFTAHAARILLVDDIETNIGVAEGLLRPYGVALDTCLSGREALALFDKNTYDIILMDHMMPEMDGLQVTAKIRAAEQKQKRPRTTVIALTANAVTGVRELLLGNGFDDFLSKPVGTRELLAIMEKWIPEEKKQRYVPQKQPAADSISINISGLDTRKGLSLTGGKAENYLAILEIFARDGAVKQKQLLQNLEEENYEGYALNAHAIKGAAAYIGAIELSELAKKHELAAKDGDYEWIRSSAAELTDELNKVVLAIKKELEHKELALRSKGDKSELVLKLAKLKNAINNLEAGTADEILRYLKSVDFGAETNEALVKLEELVLIYEYDEAVEIIEQLMGY